MVRQESGVGRQWLLPVPSFLPLAKKAWMSWHKMDGLNSEQTTATALPQ